MVYRSSRRPPSSEREPAERFSLQSDDSDIQFMKMDKGSNLRRQVGRWRLATLLLIILSIGLAIALIVVTVNKSGSDDADAGNEVCGESFNADTQIDLTEPENPGPFHDLTVKEIQALRSFLEKDKDIRAVRAEDALVNNSVIFMMDLFVAKKAEVLRFLDENGKQPARQARVIMYRGDKPTPVVEEYICGPLPRVSGCTLLTSDKRRNPIEFSLRPISPMEFEAIYTIALPKVHKEIGHIIKESFGTSFDDCKASECFKIYPSPIGTNLVDDITKRYLWVWGQYPVDYYGLHPSGLGILLDLSDSDPSTFLAKKIWYNGQLFHSLQEFKTKYETDDEFKKVKRSPPKQSRKLHSTLNQRGDPLPKTPQRPPTLVEPDGKRYTLKDRLVNYLGWSFNFKMSALTGPTVFDIRYKGERIAYELGLAEIAVFYSANNPMHRVTDFVDSGALIGSHSKSLVPGGDCPESATFINQTFPGQVVSNSVEINRAFCLFENNNGYPLRRHLSYSNLEGGFYGGMLDSVLTLRSVLTIVNYDYVVDFIFHQNGVVETRVMSTGYIFPSWYKSSEKPYGFHIDDNILGNIHHHIFHFKADLDIGGTSNRYETLDIKTEKVQLRVEPQNEYYQTKYKHHLRSTEKAALYKFNFDEPKYHVVYNNASKTRFKEIKSYRIGLHGMSKQLIPEGKSNEETIAWARYQLAVTKHKDDEIVSSSPYAMWDSKKPVTDFTKFFEDDENIVDEDLVFWITQGMHHIPHMEDLPVTPTVGNHLTFFLFPYNYFDECPSMSSRDQIRIEHKDPSKPEEGVRVMRYGNSNKQCKVPNYAQAYDDLLEEDPDVAIESKKFRGIF